MTPFEHHQDSDRDHPSRAGVTQELGEVVAALKVLQRGGSGGAVSVDAFDEATKKLPGKGELIKAAPAIAMICGTTIFLSIMAVFVTLTVVGKPTDELFRLMNLFLNAVGAIGVLFTLAVAIRSANRTMENRKIALSGRAEAHTAAGHAETAAKSVNGDLDRRIGRVVEPIVRRVVEDAARTVIRDAVRDAVRDHRQGR